MYHLYMNNAAVSTKSGIHRAALAESVYWKSITALGSNRLVLCRCITLESSSECLARLG